MSVSTGPVNDTNQIDEVDILVPTIGQVLGSPDIYGIVYRRPGLEDYTLIWHNTEQAQWDLCHLPDILYWIRPPPQRMLLAAPVQMSMCYIFGVYVNYFPCLPDQISSMVEGWRLEAWHRLDPRITGQDIINRVNPYFRHQISQAIIDQRRQYFRQYFHVTCWESTSWASELEHNGRIIRQLRDRGIDLQLNSTRGLTPGLISRELGEQGGRVLLPPYPILCTMVTRGSVAYGLRIYPLNYNTQSFHFMLGAICFRVDMRTMMSSNAYYRHVSSNPLASGFQVPIPVPNGQCYPQIMPLAHATLHHPVPESQAMAIPIAQIPAMPQAQMVAQPSPDAARPSQTRVEARAQPRKRAASQYISSQNHSRAKKKE